MGNELAIRFKDFSFKYTSQASPTLYNINLEIRKGEKVLVCGPSGSGKSTIGHCINGLIPTSYSGEMTGTLEINGKDADYLDIFEVSKMVGTVLQDSDGQFIGLTVGEDIAFSLENDQVAQDEMHRIVDRVAESVGIGGRFLGHAPHELSGGQKQRVSLAGVLVDDVDILLFDEPLANLDPATGKTTIDMIDRIHKETGKTVIIIEHRLEDVLYRDVDRIVLVAKGRIVADMKPSGMLCSDVLRSNGIREPLYITALKYAGVQVTPDKNPQRIDVLDLSDTDKESVRSWYRSVPSAPEPDLGEILLEAKGVSFAYANGSKKVGRNAVEDIDFSVRRGEMMSIVGTNGAGKSTFSKVICGFEKQQKGMILLSGTDMEKMSIKERADHVGYVMQNPNQMISKAMIREEVGLGLTLEGRSSPSEITARVDDTLRICGLYPMRSWPVSALSFGQKKRVTIASILSMKPEMIILDEPTAGQDFRHYTDIMEFLSELNRRGVTIIMITHDMHLMLEYCHRAVVFSDGHIIADDSCENILTRSDIVKRASLKETSLSVLSRLCGIPDESDFIRRFISVDRQRRADHAGGAETGAEALSDLDPTSLGGDAKGEGDIEGNDTAEGSSKAKKGGKMPENVDVPESVEVTG